MALTGLILEPDSAPYTSTSLDTTNELIDGDKFTFVGTDYWYTHYAYGLDFGVSTTISGMTVYGIVASSTPTDWYSSSYDSFSVYKSDDNSTWTLVESFDGPPLVHLAALQWGFELAFSANQTARFFKIVYTDTTTVAFQPGGLSGSIGEIVPHFVGVPYSANKITLTIDGSKIDGDLNNFPINITLSSGTGINSYDATPIFDSLTTSGTDDYTKVLLHMDGDQSSSKHTMTFAGNPQIYSTGVFDGSIYFDGTGDKITTPDSEDWNVGSGDFTVDFWLKRVGNATRQFIFGQSDSSANESSIGVMAEIDTSNQVKGGLTVGSTIHYVTSSGIDTDWHHIALVRHSDTLELFIDGTSNDTLDVTGYTANNSSDLFGIGGLGGYASLLLNAYIAEFRFSKGTARWTSNFTPPTTRYESDSNTQLLLHFEGDSSSSGHTLIFSSNIQSSYNVDKWRGTYYFDGSSWITINNNYSDWDFAGDDFTVDWWEYRTSAAYGEGTCSTDDAGGYRGLSAGYVESGGANLLVYMSSDGATWDITGVFGKTMGSVTTNDWVHLAIVRSGNNFYTFKNGVQQATWSSSASLYHNNQPFAVGANKSGYEFNGYINEFRISKGVARWTTAFTPPKGPYGSSWDNRKKIMITDSNDNPLYTEIENWSLEVGNIASKRYTHYADNTLGDKYNMSDGSLATYVQNYTYCAIDFGTVRNIERFRVAVHNSTARTNLLGQKLQGSNNSTNGSDGSWTDLITFDSINFGTPAVYPGFGNWIAVNGTHSMYRLTGVANNNTVTNEWEFIETPNNVPTATLWTKVPTIASGTDTVLYLYYDVTKTNNIETIGDTGQYQAQNVWDSNFKAVYHMTQDPSTGTDSILDSTTNDTYGTPNGSMTSGDLVDGKIGKAIDFDGSDDYINLNSISTTAWTAEVIAKPAVSTQSGDGFIIFDGKGIVQANGYWAMIQSNDVQKKGNTLSTSGDFVNIAATSDGVSTYKMYENGIENSSNHTNSGWALSGQYYIGRGYSSRTPQGIIDEVRVSDIVRPDAWVKATYHSNFNDLIRFATAETILFYFSNPLPTDLSTVYGTSHQLYLTATISGTAPSYVYDAEFYNASDNSLINTVSGVQSGNAADVLFSTPSGTNYQWYVTATSSGSQDTSSTYTFTNKFLCSGQTQINDIPASGIPVRLYRRSTGEYIGGVISSGVSGTFDISTDYNEYHYLVALYTADDTNAIIADWLTPNN